MSELMVFIHVDAIWLARPLRVVGPVSDYERLPWFDGERDRNGSVPHIASAINAPPFTDHQSWLEPGVHLLWSLPDGLTHGASRRSAERPVQVGDLWFPPAPNRWLVLQRDAANNIQRAWMVESDYVHKAGLRPDGVIAYPRPTYQPGEPPYFYLGRQFELAPDTMAPLAANPPISPMGPGTSLGDYGPILTALGPGDPLFAAHYPGCRSVFGFHDASPPLGVMISYSVYGWYSEGVVDPLANMVAALRTDPKATEALELLTSAAKKAGNAPPDPDPAKLTDAQWNDALLLDLADKFAWSATLGTGLAFPTNLVCAGSTRITAGTEATITAVSSAEAISIGSSSAEAVAAWLMNGDTLPPMDEDRLVQALAATDLKSHPLDLGQKLAEARHNEQFRAFRGHTIWMIRPAEAEGSAAGQDAGIVLPDELAHELSILNERQQDYDRANDAIAALRQELFGDWSQYMTAAYPEGESDALAVDDDAVRELVQYTRLEPLEALQRQTGRVFRGRDTAGNVVITTEHPLTVAGPLPAGPMAGEPGGTGFAEAVPAGIQISGFQVWEDKVIYDVGFLGDSTRRSAGGNLHEVPLAPGENFTAIFGESGAWFSNHVVINLGFETNFGRRFGPWGSNPASATTPFRLEAPDGTVIVGLRGRTDIFLNAIGILVAPVSHMLDLEDPPGSTLAQAVVDQHSVVQSLLKGLDQALVIGPAPGPRFWRPNDPLIALDDPAATATSRHGSDGRGEPGGLLMCVALSLTPSWNNSGSAFGGVARAPQSDRPGPWHLSEHLMVVSSSDGENWHALQLEWEVELKPLAEGGNIGAGSFAPNFVTRSQDLPVGSADLVPKSQLPRERTWQYLAGRTILNPSAGQLMSGRISSIPSDIAAKLTKTPNSLMVLSLGGFHDQLLMQCQEPQIDITDPIGLPGQTSFTARVRNAVDGLHPTSPMPDNPFHPIRSGDLVIERLRVIDSFGRTKTWQPNRVLTASAMRPEANVFDHAVLPVRFSQAARLDFRWLSAADGDIETNAHPATSPVCGWLLPNELDGEVAVYERTGRLLGSAGAGGKWDPAPGDVAAPRSWREITEPSMRRILRWLTLPSSTDAIGSFLEMLGAALEQIDPLDAAQHQARSLLIGRPIAVVRARLDFTLRHPPAIDQSWNALRARIAGGEDDSHGLGAVEIPVRLGELDQLNDGLCGYWIEDGASFRDDTFYTLHGIQPGTPHERIRVLGDEPLGKFPILLSAEGPAQLVTMLVDPRGVVHATCGILPVKSIAIPPEHYTAQVTDLRTTFRTEPILTPPDEVSVPLPSEPGYSWSWIEYTDGNWQETPHYPTVREPDLVAGFGSIGRQLWDRLVDMGRIVLLDSPDSGVLMPGDPASPANRFDDLGLTAQAVERGLHDLSHSISEPGIAATYGPRVVAREGWLQLRTAPLPVGWQKDAAQAPGAGLGS